MTAGRTHDLIVPLIVRTAGGQRRFLATTRLADGRLVGDGNDVRSDSALQHKLNWRWPMCQYPSLRAVSLKKSAFLSEDRYALAYQQPPLFALWPNLCHSQR